MALTKASMSGSASAVPAAGGDAVPGGYGGPTPHANTVAQAPYQAPSGQALTAGAGVQAHGGFDAMASGLGAPTATPGEASEGSVKYDVGRKGGRK